MIKNSMNTGFAEVSQLSTVIYFQCTRLRHFDRELGYGGYKNMLNVDLSTMFLFVRLEVRGILF